MKLKASMLAIWILFFNSINVECGCILRKRNTFYIFNSIRFEFFSYLFYVLCLTFKLFKQKIVPKYNWVWWIFESKIFCNMTGNSNRGQLFVEFIWGKDKDSFLINNKNRQGNTRWIQIIFICCVLMNHKIYEISFIFF